jgi:hypothetical protein
MAPPHEQFGERMAYGTGKARATPVDDAGFVPGGRYGREEAAAIDETECGIA